MAGRGIGLGIAVAGGVGVAAAAYVLAPDAAPEEASSEAAPATARPRSKARRGHPAALVPRPFVRGGSVAERAGLEAGPRAQPPPAGSIDPAEAQTALEGVLAQMDAMVAESVVLDERGFATWERRANAAFAAYQSTVDAGTPEGAEALEQARRALVRSLRSLRSRIRRDPRRPEWMDAVP